MAKERRRFHNDKFREENGYSWDYVFAFKVYEEDEVVSDDQQKYNMKYVLAHLAMGGIETRLSYSVQVCCYTISFKVKYVHMFFVLISILWSFANFVHPLRVY